MNKETKRIYMDNAATSPVLPEVVDAMLPIFNEYWGNPSSLHTNGQLAKEILDSARADVASSLGCDPKEIFFTSCGSESDNWAIKGAVRASKIDRWEIVTTVFEHHAVLHTCEALEKEGYKVKYVPVTEKGIVDLDALREAVTENTAIVAVMFANNEIGTIQPIKEIAEIAHAKGAVMFTDAVQAVGALDINVKELGVDMLALSGHKLGAPKGVGALYIKKGTRVKNLIDGGGQEKNRRAGTENVPYIVGLAKAMKIADERRADNARIIAMRNRLIDGLLEIPYTILNGDRDNRLPGNVNVSFEFVEGESLLLWLDMMGISASTGSACSSNTLEASHVLLSIGLPIEKAHGSIRFSLSHANTEEEVDKVIEAMKTIVARLRAMSPIYPGNN